MTLSLLLGFFFFQPNTALLSNGSLGFRSWVRHLPSIHESLGLGTGKGNLVITMVATFKAMLDYE